MAILRELVTRFKFETDTKGIKQFNSNLGGMRASLGKFAAVLGIGLGAKEIFDVSQNALQAQTNLKRFAGTNFSALRQQFRETTRELNILRAGTGNLATRKEFDLAAGNFIRTFGQGQNKLQQFREIWSFAARQSALTNQNANDIVTTIQQGIQGGGFGALLDIPGFDQFRQKMLEFQQEILDPKEPSQQIALERRFQTFIQIMRQARQEQEASLQSRDLLPEQLIQTNLLGKQTSETFADLGQSIKEALIPPFQKLNELLGEINKRAKEGFLLGVSKAIAAQFSDDKTQIDSVKTPFTGTLRSLRSVLGGNTAPSESDPVVTPGELLDRAKKKNGLSPGGIPFLEDAGRRRESDRERFIGSETVINQSNTINIRSTDPLQTGREVEKMLDQKIKDAKESVRRTEAD